LEVIISWVLFHREAFAWAMLLLTVVLLIILLRRQAGQPDLLHKALQPLLEQLKQLEQRQQQISMEQQRHLAKQIMEQTARQYQAIDQLKARLEKDMVALQHQVLEQQSRLLQQQTKDASALRENLLQRFESLRRAVTQSLTDGSQLQQRALNNLKETVNQQLTDSQQQFEQRQSEALKNQQNALNQGFKVLGEQVAQSLKQSRDELGQRVNSLTETTDKRLKDISGQVENRLSEGFKKTTETFNNVLVHLTRIDEAQRKITELSSNVVSLQEVLADKRSRGAFGEVQLNALIHNVMPQKSYSLQHVLSNGKRADCVLFLPEPTGTLAIDAKFPLESYQKMTNFSLAESDRNLARSQFRRDIKKHIRDIAEKYILPGETSDGAVMFIPAEAVFAEIHAAYPDLVEEAFARRVWMVSPTTMMAIVTTARAVLKDAETRKQVHIIQKHLGDLSKDFERFDKRMGDLAKHIDQANRDVGQIQISAKKISKRFVDIETVELDEEEQTKLPVFKKDALKSVDSGKTKGS